MTSALLKRRNLPLLLLQAQDALMAEFRPVLNRHGLTDPQWRVLRALLAHTELEPWQLCEHAWIGSPSMPGILSRMEQTGLLERRIVESDQRRRLISMTAKGRRTVIAAAADIEQSYVHFERRIGKLTMQRAYEVMDEFLGKAAFPVAGAEK
jgi:homoprotocatechuate degradation regulator HpaR